MDGGKKRAVNVLLAILLALTLTFIWGNSLLSREVSAEASGELMSFFSIFFRRLGLDTQDDHWLRKTAHFMEFGLLGCELALLFFLNRGRRLSSAAFAASAVLAAALTDEGLQFISGRAPEWRDVARDVAGGVFGILLITVLTGLRQKRKRKIHHR